ncbi:hypothetical protein GIB67_042417 [Kingdonia uniflora]|uniref:3-hydroxyisobutyrate dehydrogenase-like NAD-binding domain-containing protein n=1 Tax=Kingdonia uniflora TaxID=39325 RepID=A0A7J7M8B1_9MAGN|nr:hypothetical protein GIB67_042417 [Kingdonia uniflora]
MSSSSLLQGERQGDNTNRLSSFSSSSSSSGSSSSGDKALYDMVSPFLDIMGKSRVYLGDVGNGTEMKLVVNMIMGSMMASFSEGLLLSEKVGLDPKILVKVVSQGAISAPMFSLKGPSMVQSKYPTSFPLKLQSKYPTAFPLKHQHKVCSLPSLSEIHEPHYSFIERSKITSFIGSPDSVMDLVSFIFDIMKLGNRGDIYSDIDFRVFCVIFTQGFVTKIFIGFV